MMKEEINIKNIRLKDIRNKSIQINVNSSEIYKSVKEILSKNKIEYFTFTPRDEKPKSIILKGIKGDFSAKDIQDEICSLNLNNTEIIKIVKTKLSQRQDAQEHFFIQITPSSDPKNLYNIKTLACQKIRWEKYRSNKVFQCRNCQRVGHSSNNCKLEYRCVKCLDQHEPGKCSR